jgi:transposase-like protein
VPRKRRSFSAAFKAKVALDAHKGLNTVGELAKQHQVHPTQMAFWKKQLLEGVEGVLVDSLKYQSQPDFITSISHVGQDRYQVRLDGKASGRDAENEPRLFVDWNFSDNIPIKYVIYPSQSSETPTTVETVEWKKVNDTALPHASRRSFRSTMAFDNGLKFYVEYEQTTELHWFSFNEELADELFDPNLLKDRAKVDELLSDHVFEKK